MIKAIIVDDEEMALFVLSEMLKEYDSVEVLKTYRNPKLALEEVLDVKPDVIFLDIEMGDLNGIKVAEELIDVYPSADIVFVTAYSEYAIEAFELNAIDYLLKPVIPKRLKKSLDRIYIDKQSTEEEPGLYIKSFGSFNVINENEAIKWRTAKAKELFAYLWLHQKEIIDRSRLIETLFPMREVDRGNTLFSTTLYQMRKNISRYLGDDFLTNTNGSYSLNAKINSDLARVYSIINSKDYTSENIKLIKQLYVERFLEYEDYSWKIEVQVEIEMLLKMYLLNYYKTLNDSGINTIVKEDILLLLYKIDYYDSFVLEKIYSHYEKTNQLIKLKDFQIRHLELIGE